MFKRLLNWLRPKKVEEPEEWYAWVIYKNQYIKVPRPVPAKPIKVRDLGPNEVRPHTVQTVSNMTLQERDKRNRRWWADRAPDECLFL